VHGSAPLSSLNRCRRKFLSDILGNSGKAARDLRPPETVVNWRRQSLRGYKPSGVNRTSNQHRSISADPCACAPIKVRKAASIPPDSECMVALFVALLHSGAVRKGEPPWLRCLPRVPLISSSLRLPLSAVHGTHGTVSSRQRLASCVTRSFYVDHKERGDRAPLHQFQVTGGAARSFRTAGALGSLFEKCWVTTRRHWPIMRLTKRGVSNVGRSL